MAALRLYLSLCISLSGLGEALVPGSTFVPAAESPRGLMVSPGTGAMLTSALGTGSAGVAPTGAGELPTTPSDALPQPTSSRASDKTSKRQTNDLFIFILLFQTKIVSAFGARLFKKFCLLRPYML